MYDICIIGAGVTGSAIARELAKYELKICLLEKDEDVSNGSSKANSGIVHGGYAAKHGSVKAELCAKGNSMYQQLDDELHFGFARVGSLVIGFNAEDKKVLQELYDNGIKNGAKGLELVSGDFVKQKEPYLNKEITAALYCSSAGITSPYEFTIALAENAIENGVSLKLNYEVNSIKKEKDYFIINNEIKTKIIINAAGLYADDVAQLVGLNDFKINPRQGQYILFDKDQGELVNSVIFQTPTKVSKGILVTKTYHGNLLIGPNAEEVTNKDYLDTTKESIDDVIKQAKKTLADFDLKKIITSFSGNRAAPNNGDFIIAESSVKGFINVAGIESPGLTAAPAIAVKVKNIVNNIMSLTAKKNFNPYRKAYKTVVNMAPEELDKLIKQEPAYGRIICRCETVSEGEILDSLSRPIPINSLDAIKRRTRAGMGRCQSGFCAPKIMEIICDKLNIDAAHITKKGHGAELLLKRTKKALKK